jgi:hypothetical protein
VQMCRLFNLVGRSGLLVGFSPQYYILFIFHFVDADAVIETNTTSVDTSSLEDIDSETVTALPPLPVQNDPVSEKVSQLSAAVSSLTSVFGPVFMRGVFSFATWWMSFVV